MQPTQHVFYCPLCICLILLACTLHSSTSSTVTMQHTSTASALCSFAIATTACSCWRPYIACIAMCASTADCPACLVTCPLLRSCLGLWRRRLWERRWANHCERLCVCVCVWVGGGHRLRSFTSEHGFRAFARSCNPLACCSSRTCLPVALCTPAPARPALCHRLRARCCRLSRNAPCPLCPCTHTPLLLLIGPPCIADRSPPPPSPSHV